MSETDEDVEDVIRETLEKQLEEHDLETVFWSLDSVYDEYDERMQDHMTEEAPVYEARVIVPSETATSGEEYDTRTIEGPNIRSEDDAREQALQDPEVREVENIEQTDTLTVVV